ncbi:MAG: DNA polymerase IV [Elusimicrobiota bacterium]
MSHRLIIHIDMDAFFAQVEQRADPALAGKPVFVTARSRRSVVAAASYEAKKFGVKSGMNLSEARALCPAAVLVPPRFDRYAEISDDIFLALVEFSPQVEAASIDEFYLDVTLTAARWGGAEALAREIKRRVHAAHGLTCSAGVAPNKLLAKWAAGRSKPDGLFVLPPEDVPATLERLPVGELCGIGPALRGRLRTLGVLSCGELARFPEGELAAHFGVWGHHLAAMGRGRDDAPVAFAADEAAPKSFGAMQTLDEDVRDRDALQSWLLVQCERVAARLRRRRLAGDTVSLLLRDSAFINWNRSKRWAAPTQDAQEILRRAWKLFPERAASRAFRLVGVSVGGLAPDRQLSLLPEDEKRRRLNEVRDRLNQKFGDQTLIPARLSPPRRKK